MTIEGMISLLQPQYPQAQISTAQTAQRAIALLSQSAFDLAIVDLDLPETTGSKVSNATGIDLVSHLMSVNSISNIFIFSSSIQPLVRISSRLSTYRGGLVAVEKKAPISTILSAVEQGLQGDFSVPVDSSLPSEFSRRWFQLLNLKYEQALSDQAIANVMGLSDRTIRNYWMRIQDFLNIPDDAKRDTRIQIQIAVRNVGLVD